MPSRRSDSIGWAGGRSGAIFEISLKSRFLVAFCFLFCPSRPSRPGKCPEAPWGFFGRVLEWGFFGRVLD